MRENPWHLRLPTTEHYQWYQNLIDLHELTESWLREVHSDRPSHLLTRGLSPKITENLWMLDSISDVEIENLTDDTQVEDTLGRLEQTVWSVQAWTLNALINRTKSTDKPALDRLLEQLSWKMGKKCVESRWKPLVNQQISDLRELILCLKDSPLSGYPHGDPFLVRRSVAAEVQVELRFCPHQIQYTEVTFVADRLCELHRHWMQGFIYELNSKATVEHLIRSPPSPRCLLRWSLG